MPRRAAKRVGQDDAPRVDEEGQGVVDDPVASPDEVQGPDGVPVGHVGGEDRERFPRGRRVDGEEGAVTIGTA